MALLSNELLTLFRSEVDDKTPEYLWSDDEIYGYMDDAQKMFCRLTGGIADAVTDEVCLLSFGPDTEFVTIDPRILLIKQARRQSDFRQIRVLNAQNFELPSTEWDYGMPRTLRLDGSTGTVEAIVTDMVQDMVRCVPISNANQEVRLVVTRLPLHDIVGTNQMFEIQEQHHRHLLHWMKHLAYSKQDAETFDKGKAEEFRLRFLAYCDQAKTERERREHKPREVVYGGIPM